MPFSSSNISALRRITELAGSSEPGDERLSQVLTVAREALGLDALSVVVTSGTPGEVRTWHSTSGTDPVDSSVVENAMAEANKAGAKPDSSDGRVFIPIPPVNGFRGVIVGQGAACAETEIV